MLIRSLDYPSPVQQFGVAQGTVAWDSSGWGVFIPVAGFIEPYRATGVARRWL